VVLIDEKTSSDGEGFARGVAELKLGKLVGRRTWGGGIWLSSDNTLVDGGIASAPEIGQYDYDNEWGWGMGIEGTGVTPDYQVDNDLREDFDGAIDRELERGIEVLRDMIDDANENDVRSSSSSSSSSNTVGGRAGVGGDSFFMPARPGKKPTKNGIEDAFCSDDGA
jgi:C-terminal processing protease CtpA/Prc